MLPVILGLWAGASASGPVQAQGAALSVDSVSVVVHVAGGRPVAVPETVPLAPGVRQEDAVARAVRRALEKVGFPFARVDSAHVAGAQRAVWVTPGLRRLVASVEIEGVASRLAGMLAEDLLVQPGGVLAAETLERDARFLADALAWRGFPDASVTPHVTELDFAGEERTLRGKVVDEGEGPRVVFRVDVGERAVLRRVEVSGGRLRPEAVARLTDLAPGDPFQGADLEAIRQGLLATGLFESVGTPTLARTVSGDVVLQVPAEAGPPGLFDLVLGYLPPAGGKGGGVVGTGRLDLLSPFGGGRHAEVALRRLPGLVSSFDFTLRDPFVAGLPVSAEVSFVGRAQDSTYARQRGAVQVGTRVARGLEVSLLLARESTAPGRGADGEVAAIQRVRSASSWLAGVAFTLRRLDRPLNPRQGLRVETLVEQGRRVITGELLEKTRVSEQRLTVESRGYLPLARAHVLALGLEARAVFGVLGERPAQPRFDEGDLLRIGGAATLRGYDEDAFMGNLVGRGLMEYRFLIDEVSFAFAFADLGVVSRPALRTLEAEQRLLPGYGLGAQLRTGLGLTTLTYAVSPDLPLTRGKIHLGLTVGL